MSELHGCVCVKEFGHDGMRVFQVKRFCEGFASGHHMEPMRGWCSCNQGAFLRAGVAGWRKQRRVL